MNWGWFLFLVALGALAGLDDGGMSWWQGSLTMVGYMLFLRVGLWWAVDKPIRRRR